MELFAIYRPVATDEQVRAKDTLVFNRDNGFAWIRQAEGDNNWHAVAVSASAAEKAAREAGFDPKQVFYPEASGLD